MREIPVLFSAAMVRAILDGRKTETRRVVKPQPDLPTSEWCAASSGTGRWMGLGPSQATGGTRQTWGWASCPYGQPGDRLWVREAWRVGKGYDDAPGSAFTSPTVWYGADGDPPLDRAGRYRHARFMPRWASRITLEVTGVRVERLQDISEVDAKAEGAEPLHAVACTPGERELLDLPLLDADTPYRNGFASLWESINGAGSWDANPWVWVVEFRRIEQEAKAA